MFSGEKKKFIQLLPDKSVVLPFVIDCKLERPDSESGWCSASCSVVVSLCCTITVIKLNAYAHELFRSTILISPIG